MGWAKRIILPGNLPWLMTFPPQPLATLVVLLGLSIAREGIQLLQMSFRSIKYAEGTQVIK